MVVSLIVIGLVLFSINTSKHVAVHEQGDT